MVTHRCHGQGLIECLLLLFFFVIVIQFLANSSGWAEKKIDQRFQKVRK